jgi:hypothetical protein
VLGNHDAEAQQWGTVIAAPLSERRVDVDLDADLSNRKSGLLLTDVIILGRKGMARVQRSLFEALGGS